ncbi:MAG: hypothetical protein ABSG42_02060, partial [Nitrospirota bacterium]
MAIKSFKALMERAREICRDCPPPRVAVCAAEDKSSIEAMEILREMGMARPILIGDKRTILDIMAASRVDPGNYRIEDVYADEDKAALSVKLVRDREADILMKGMIPTSTFL